MSEIFISSRISIRDIMPFGNVASCIEETVNCVMSQVYAGGALVWASIT
jgi:hypothetical protein